MVRTASNASVSEIEVEIDRPADRDRKRNRVGGAAGSASVSITGSGSTGTLFTNNSATAWYLESVTASAAGAGDVVAVTVDVKDAQGNTKYSGTTGATSGVIPLGGVPVLSGESVDYTVTQSDANSYTVNIHPVIRQPDPETESSDTVNSTQLIDSFEDGGISEYGNSTADFSVISDPTFDQSNALQNAATGSSSWMYSTSGLPNYPGSDDAFKFHVRSSAVGTSSNHSQEVWFGADSTGDAYAVRFNWHENDNAFVVKLDGASTLTVLDEAKNVSGGYTAGRWYRGEVDRGDTTTVELYDTETKERVASMSMTDTAYESNSGIGFRNRSAATGETYEYDALELI